MSLIGIARGCLVAAMSAVVLAGLAPASAQSSPITVSEGPVLLPTSGLRIDAPAAPGRNYKVSGSWAFNAADNSFDTRDVIDEANATTGAVVAGNWVLVGYFTAGDCAAVVGEEALDAAWTQDIELWGLNWAVRGGVYTFTNELGRRPAALMCSTNAGGRSLLLYRFLVDQPDTTGKDAVMASVRTSAILERAARAWSSDTTGDSQPLRRTEVRNRGTDAAARTVTLPVAGLTFDIPPDGYFWLVEKATGADGETDMITRLLPSLPEVVLEVLPVKGVSCATLLPQLPQDRPNHRASDLPPEWTSGASILVEGDTELVACRATAYGSLMVGVFQGEVRTSLAALHPMLAALAAGTLED
jgi:hypothetical protein